MSKFARRLPSHAFRTKYVELRLEMLEEAVLKLELQIMTIFLLQERKRQKHLRCLEGKMEEPQTPTPAKTGKKCYDCKKEGHIAFDCPEKG